MRIRYVIRGSERNLNRYTTRMLSGHRPPMRNDLAIAAKAILGVIRSHKRLIKLAPNLFDYAATAQSEREDEIQRQLRPLLDKVYGIGNASKEKPV
jgi:hypothetical protein